MRQMTRRLAAHVLALLFVASATNAAALCACLFDDMSGSHAMCMGHEGMAASTDHGVMAAAQSHDGMAASHACSGAATSDGREGVALTRGHHGMATSQLVVDCCSRDGQPGARGIVEERVNLKPVAGARADMASTVEHSDAMAAAGASAQMAHREPPAVPIYLQHLSLLI